MVLAAINIVEEVGCSGGGAAGEVKHAVNL